MTETRNLKFETLNKSEVQNPKQYNLSKRTFEFTARVIDYLNGLPRGISSNEISKQLTRSAGSVGANYLEEEESLSKKDFITHIKIAKKEAGGIGLLASVKFVRKWCNC
jgi:lipoate-protein ligase A